MPVSERKAVYDAQYLKQYQRQFVIKVNRKNDPEMVEWLESQESVQTYIKNLIRQDMERRTRT